METNDHDMLIKIHTILEGVVDDMRQFRKDNYNEMEKMRISISSLDTGKVGLIEYNRHIIESQKRDEKVDTDISMLKRTVYIATGVLAAAQFLAPLFMSGRIHF